jgi:hypothetical protein
MDINLSKLYEMTEAFKRGAFRPDVPDYENMGRDLLREYHRAQRQPLKPLQLSWAEGSRLVDYTGTAAVLPDVISQRFADVLNASGATGWSTYPVELHGKSAELIEGYYGLAVTGRCGPLLGERSRLEMRVGPSGKSITYKVGFYFDEATWDGSDVFTPNDTAFVFVSDKVKRALEKAKITNVAFTSLDSVAELYLKR